MPDSPRYCATHDAYGDHHTDRCPLTFDDSPEAHDRRMLAEARRLAAFHEPDRPVQRTWRTRIKALFTRA